MTIILPPCGAAASCMRRSSSRLSMICSASQADADRKYYGRYNTGLPAQTTGSAPPGKRSSWLLADPRGGSVARTFIERSRPDANVSSATGVDYEVREHHKTCLIGELAVRDVRPVTRQRVRPTGG